MTPGDLSPLPGFSPGPADSNVIHRFAHSAMATLFEIFCDHKDAGYARQAAGAAFDLVDQLEQELSCHRHNSDIARINHLNAGQELQVSSWTMECLVLARCFYLETGGAFDISLGSGFERLELIPDDFVVRLRTGGVRLDLGGIGKGYAIDRTGEVLEEWGITQALLHAGFSSVLALDAPSGKEGWSLTMSRPGVDRDAVFARVMACRQAMSSSGIRKGDHIRDPRSGLPVRHRPGAWVSGGLETLKATYRRPPAGTEIPEWIPADLRDSPSAAAEALSTAFMILPLAEIDDCCRRHAGLQAWLLESDPADPAAPALLTHFG